MAPEKIYLYPSDRADEEYEDEWGDLPWGEDYVEYICKDVFIDKACEWLENLYAPDGSIALCHVHIIEDFRKYIKGE